MAKKHEFEDKRKAHYDTKNALREALNKKWDDEDDDE